MKKIISFMLVICIIILNVAPVVAQGLKLENSEIEIVNSVVEEDYVKTTVIDKEKILLSSLLEK